MKIEPPVDDLGTQSLRNSNQQRQVKEADQLSPYPSIQRSDRRTYRRLKRKPVERQGDRRQAERRLRKGRKLFDTRDNRDRRLGPRRQGERKLRQGRLNRFHIDIEV